MVDARASRTASGGMRHASPVRLARVTGLSTGVDSPALQCASPRLALQETCSVLLFITVVPNTKLCAWGEEDRGEHVL
jgi:hypothetical protein